MYQRQNAMVIQKLLWNKKIKSASLNYLAWSLVNKRITKGVLRRVHSEGVGKVVRGGAAGHGRGQPARRQRRQLRAAARR